MAERPRLGRAALLALTRWVARRHVAGAAEHLQIADLVPPSTSERNDMIELQLPALAAILTTAPRPILDSLEHRGPDLSGDSTPPDGICTASRSQVTPT